MGCNCKRKKTDPVNPQEAFDAYLKHKNGQELSIGERDLLYFFHNQQFGTKFETYCKHCWDSIIKNLEGLWANQQG